MVLSRPCLRPEILSDNSTTAKRQTELIVGDSRGEDEERAPHSSGGIILKLLTGDMAANVTPDRAQSAPIVLSVLFPNLNVVVNFFF